MLYDIHQKLGIPESYLRDSKIPIYGEPDHLVLIGKDIYGRPQKLSQDAAKQWHSMWAAASEDNIILFVVSAFRSVAYQESIIKSKIDKGHSIEDILKVNAAPGCSEHHSGRALDLTTESCETLCETFDKTNAFHWLSVNAFKYGFTMSYPKKNKYGICYEPWHWCYTGG